MKIYRVYRTDNVRYDEYDSAVVVAENEELARDSCPFDASDHEVVKVEIVSNKAAGVVLASYNAG